jgi:ABC-type branched-subunit amino acid transport system substrate-binding protein
VRFEKQDGHTMQQIRHFLAALVLASLPLPALAHSFNVAIVTPLSGASAQTGRDVLDGFRLATRERDGHAGEESDGHLGGLDVYMLPVDATGDTAALLGRIDAPDFVLIIAPDPVPQGLLPGAVDMGPGDMPGFTGTGAKSAGVTRFLQQFEADYGRAASRSAAQGYNAARRIDLAVRLQEGTDDRAALENSLRQSADSLDW